jgi:rfaE bifunctional protein nucleotidyltransferase chain/domain
MSIVVNKYPKVMAALVHNLDTSRKCREHNDSNVLCLGGWITTKEQSIQILDNWLDEPFGEGRHVKRIEKILPHDDEKIVFTNGIFDVLHTGHIDLLKFAKSLGNKLIVGINSDRTTRILKGEHRPIYSEIERKNILESIRYVDEVVIFDDTDTIDIVREVNPDIIVKGGEWTSDEVRIRDEIPDGIDVKIFPLASGYSTTDVIKKIKGLVTWEKSGINK